MTALAALDAVGGKRPAMRVEATVVARMVVPGGDHRRASIDEFGNERADTGQDFIALGHPERAAGKKVVLNVNNQEGVGGR